MKATKKTIQYGEHQLSIETGEIARQASGAVLVSLGETVVMVTVVGKKEARPGQDFFPLTVDYQEKTYAAGKFLVAFLSAKGDLRKKRRLLVA